MDQITYTRTLVTPEKAAEYLLTNSRNRNLNTRTVNKYVLDIVHGHWGECMTPIVFDTSGRLIDGQHRCQAVINSNTPLWFMVVRGAPDDTWKTLDIGRPRTPADVLQIQGYPNSHQLAPIARKSFILGQSSWPEMYGSSSLSFGAASSADIEEEARKDDVQLVAATNHNVAKPMTGFVPPSDVGMLRLVVLRGAGTLDEIDYFLGKVEDLSMLEANSPIMQLSKIALSYSSNKTKVIKNYYGVGLMVKAWNLWVNGQTRALLKYSVDQEKVPEPICARRVRS